MPSWNLTTRAFPSPGLASRPTFWFVRDSAFLLLPDVAVNAQEEHTVSLILNISPPYIPGMKRVNPQTQTLRVA
jgi:hypothetical protein